MSWAKLASTVMLSGASSAEPSHPRSLISAVRPHSAMALCPRFSKVLRAITASRFQPLRNTAFPSMREKAQSVTTSPAEPSAKSAPSRSSAQSPLRDKGFGVC